MLRILEPRESSVRKSGLETFSHRSSAIHADPISRCTIYRLFSTAFRYPTLDAYQEYREGVYLAELWNNMFALCYMLPALQEMMSVADRAQTHLQGISYEDFSEEYLKTLGDIRHSDCSPHERRYRKGRGKETILNELNDFYEQFGLQMNRGDTGREALDHVSVEFEFLHYLVFKEAQSKHQDASEYLGGYVLAQRDFLERHLNRWYPRFSQKLRRLSPQSFFTATAGLAERFVALDFEAVCSASGCSADRSPFRS